MTLRDHSDQASLQTRWLIRMGLACDLLNCQLFLVMLHMVDGKV